MQTSMKTRAVEAVAGFSVACLLALALFPQPLPVSGKLATCLFAAVFPALICARVLMDGDGQSPGELSLASSLRFSAYLVAIAGFALLLKVAFWPACVVFCFAVLAVFIAWMSVLHPKKDGPPARLSNLDD
jgi:hypothetical protein